MRVTRRTALLGSAATLALTTALPAVAAPSRKLIGPFTLGIASGDPTPDGVVLWTRLAVSPLNEDGLGGMPDRVVPVHWEVAEDERFRRIARRGVAHARPEAAHTVHVEVGGLRAGREYWYRFRTGGEISPVGRTRTAPGPEVLRTELTMCFASCSKYEDGHFTAYRRLAEDHPDLVLHLGDYQYEYQGKAGDIRQVLGPETTTLAGYRQRHAQYKTDPDLQLAHATAPFLVVWDDHETENNWADEVPEQPDPHFLTRRAAAFQAYYENMPLRRGAKPNGIDLQLYRRIRWGGLVDFHMLDTRQYRDDQACGDGVRVDCAARLDPARTITGAAQERWLLDGLRGSRARWNVLGQQVFFAGLDYTAGPQKGFHMDSWGGYVASRNKIAAGLAQTRNGVVLTGDVHQHWAADIPVVFDEGSSRTAGVELVTTSITSGRDGSDKVNETTLAENPHVKFNSNRRGYVRTRFTADELRADFRTLPYVTKPDAPATTAASFVVRDREPGLHRA
ncbi:alkaline phosphatase D family protein [Crossiella cryophila]|uniref:Alkaline phosphatase D n=1 Tax=Crossiella cryophila TaxID=43355 RepID=A0A7W7FPW9_9PSEU|nr:alkaline phosphatase D family protein [Crossiella cryophila]MBB4674271.1 alkaline phosphatase D [Crossiella cryophila]